MMGRSMGGGERAFHETPLVIFTILAMAGAGLGSAHLLWVFFWEAPLGLSQTESVLLSAFLLTGMLLSTGHLGKPLRGPLALRGIGGSPLSNEVLALGIALTAGVFGLGTGFFLPGATVLLGGLGLLASGASVAFLVTLGVLYNLPGQPSWQGPSVGQPLVLGTAWGFLMGPFVVPSLLSSSSRLLLLGLLALDCMIVLLRVLRIRAARGKGAPVYPRLFPGGLRVLGLRAFLSSALTPVALVVGWWWLAASALSLALVLDRVAFYTTAVRVTSESEVSRLEALL